MKKAFLLATILLISVISTACINNFAVQELNNKAKEFMDKGDYVSAVERLKSSIDLAPDVFETRYNLAVAYTQAEDYANAIEAFNEASKINPDFADLYYSRAVCEENLSKDIKSGDVIVNDDNTIAKPVVQNDDEEILDKTELSENAKNMLLSLINSSIEDYQIYLDKAEDADKAAINSKIEELKSMTEENAK